MKLFPSLILVAICLHHCMQQVVAEEPASTSSTRTSLRGGGTITRNHQESTNAPPPTENLQEEESTPPPPAVVHQGDQLTLTRDAKRVVGLDNQGPYLGINYIVATQGTFPAYAGGRQSSGPMLGEIRMFAGNFAPAGWAFCNGQVLSIQSNSALFAILGSIYGGDGRNTFALPDFRGRSSVHVDSNHRLGFAGGVQTHVLANEHLPKRTEYTVESVV
ncbi:Hemolysin-type calcium-binding repeat 2 copies family protein [Seminavis robusta]|uniref:Hemolysin-type calcium-binding repeat 2 copies family protein n=1 Tax=Seminavis robusta TaxID=568900 RepID=A0A9N8DXE3_9STRA|nr:Hemolysin-type calcium-binding repeat 2 copies family protein [Seminavis robusta]|eukprot:Sro419_g139040.1 Hemolysin-type calcium-binding repeat 2 copies family protein (218) ;mRNA; r:23052-23705